MTQLIVPTDERSLVKGPAQLWLAKHGATLPALDEAGDGIVSFNVQTITLDSSFTDNFTLRFGDQVTGTLSDTSDGDAVETALEALSNIGEGNVQVTGAVGGPHTVTFLNWLRTAHLPLLQSDEADVEVTRDWMLAGFRENGLSVNEVEEEEQHSVDEHLTAIDRSRTVEGLEISCNVVNATLDQLTLVSPSGSYSLHAPTSTKVGHEQFAFGDGNNDPFYQALIFAKNGMGYFYARHVFKVKGLRTGERAFEKGGLWHVPMQFNAYGDLGKAPGTRLYRDYNMTETTTA